MKKHPYRKPSGFTWTNEERGISQGDRKYGAVYHCAECGGRFRTWEGEFGRKWFHTADCPNRPAKEG